jgi:hypothetical protein
MGGAETSATRTKRSMKGRFYLFLRDSDRRTIGKLSALDIVAKGIDIGLKSVSLGGRADD